MAMSLSLKMENHGVAMGHLVHEIYGIMRLHIGEQLPHLRFGDAEVMNS